jgi:hypothetical protein
MRKRERKESQDTSARGGGGQKRPAVDTHGERMKDKNKLPGLERKGEDNCMSVEMKLD